jgi:DNA repair exonuclease SbcCD ATPase subunit
MKLEFIELRNTGPFTDLAGVGPFDGGLNVMVARNEAGKTTLLMGAARALFDRHNVTGEAIERLQPVGTSLAPEVSVVFLTAEGRFRIRKRFLHAPTSELSEERNGEWHLIADGDAADSRVLELIGGVRAGRGVTKAEHWGLLRYLWARQGETVDWPAWDDEAGARIRTGLARVEIDPLVERLRSRLQEAQAEQFTSTGRVSKNSPLQIAQQAHESLESDLIEVRAEMEKVDRDLQALQQFREEWVVRGREKTEANEQAEVLTETLKQVELLQKDLERFKSAFETAQQRLNETHKDSEALRKAATSLKDAGKELEQRQSEENRALQREKEAREALIAFRNTAKTLQKKLDLGRKSEVRLRERQELHGLEEKLAALRKQLAAARKQHDALEKLRRRRAALPDVTRRQVTQLEQKERALRELTVRADAVGLRVDLKAEENVTISLDRDGSEQAETLAKGRTTTVTAARNLRLKLPGWGELDITSGAKEAVELEKQITESRIVLDGDLKKLGIPSVEDGRRRAEQIVDLDRDIKSAESHLTEWLEEWDALEALVAAVDRTDKEAEQRRARLKVSETEGSFSQAELKAELTRLHTEVGADEIAWTALQESIETQGKEIETLGSKREEALKSAGEAKNRMSSLESQTATVRARYPEGIEKTEESAQTAFVEAKAQLDVSRKKLPDDWEKLGARHDRALKSAAQATRDHQELEQKIRRLETLLDHAGSQGLYSRETMLVEAIASAKAKSARHLNNGLAARFLVGLIDYRKKAAVRTVLKPLEDQLSATFAEITGDHQRQVYLDENLQVAGIGRKRDESIAFAQLSQGAQEQLLLALRAAVALELAKNGPQILILDDVLVNTDATRQENVLDFIQNVAQHVQVLIVTCHAERYRGIGRSIGITQPQGT